MFNIGDFKREYRELLNWIITDGYGFDSDINDLKDFKLDDVINEMERRINKKKRLMTSEGLSEWRRAVGVIFDEVKEKGDKEVKRKNEEYLREISSGIDKADTYSELEKIDIDTEYSEDVVDRLSEIETIQEETIDEGFLSRIEQADTSEEVKDIIKEIPSKKRRVFRKRVVSKEKALISREKAIRRQELTEQLIREGLSEAEAFKQASIEVREEFG